MKSIKCLFVIVVGLSIAGCAGSTESPTPPSPPLKAVPVVLPHPGDVEPYIPPHIREAAQKLGLRPVPFKSSLLDGKSCGGAGLAPCPNVPDDWKAVFTASQDGLHSLGNRSAKFNSANEFAQDTLTRLSWMANPPAPPSSGPRFSRAEMEKHTQLWTQRLAGQIDFSKESAFIFHRGGGASLKTRLQLVNNQLGVCAVPVQTHGPQSAIYRSEFYVFAGPKYLGITEQTKCR